MTDDPLERELSELLARIDPVPEAAVDAGRAAFAWRTVDEDVARLTHDSLLEDEPALAGVRGEAGPRALTFALGGLLVEMEVSGFRGDDRGIVGQLVPPSAAEVVVDRREQADEDRTKADALGRFALGGVAEGEARFRIRFGDGAEVRTEWIRL